MTMITPSYLGETIEYSSLHACRSTLEDPTDFLAALQSPKYGARNVTDSINQHVEPSLRKALVMNGGRGMRSLKVGAENDQVVVTVD